MTLQQIADYAMRYLDHNKIGADYEISKKQLKVISDKGSFVFTGNPKKKYVTTAIVEFLI